MALVTRNNSEIMQREGDLGSTAYLGKFLQFMYVRTGFRFKNFTTPRHLQRLLDNLSFNRVPMEVWQAILSSTLRIANMSRSIGHKLREFGAFFIDVLVWFVKRLSNMGLLQLTLFLFNYFVHPLARAAITTVCYAVSWLLEPLWKSLSEFIQSRLITAPYYTQFVTMG